MLTWFIVWTLGAAISISTTFYKRHRGVGLVIAYIVNFAMYHYFASLMYLDGGPTKYSHAVIHDGFRLSAIAMISFAFGAVVLGGLVLPRRDPKRSIDFDTDRSLPAAYLLLGLVLNFILTSFLGSIPTLQALSAVGGSLVSVGLCLYLWTYVSRGRYGRSVLVMGFVLAMPIITIVSSGYIGFGLGAVVLTGSFLVSWFRHRGMLLIAGLLVGFIGLSAFVTYMRDRAEIRSIVWSENPMADRLEVVGATFSDWEWFTLKSPDHRRHIDDRLNQNFLVGKAVEQLSYTGDYLQGRSLWESVLSLVPRALWPDKPVYAGSGNLVSQATGISYNEQTSVGVGHVLEFYINFGPGGVVLGFILLGLVIRLLDVRARRGLRDGDWQSFAFAFAVGLPFLVVGGSFVALTAAVGASALVMTGINKLVLDRLQRPPLPRLASEEPLSAPLR